MAVTATTLKNRLSFSASGAKAVLEILIAWEDINAYIEQEFGATFFGHANGFTAPLRASHPDWPWLWLESLDIVPYMDSDPPHDSSRNYPNGALVTATYSATPFSDLSYPITPFSENDTWLTHDIEGTMELVTLKSSQLQWEFPGHNNSKTIPPEIVSGVRIPLTKHTLTWHHVTTPPWDTIRELLGCVNADPWPTTFPTVYGFASQTLLFANWSAKKSYATNDLMSVFYTLTYTFIHRAFKAKFFPPDGSDPVEFYAGWNHFPRLDDVRLPWQRVMLRSDNSPIYRCVNFDPLFRQA